AADQGGAERPERPQVDGIDGGEQCPGRHPVLPRGRLMLLRCPACKAENTSGPICRRCKAELSMLFALEEQRDRLLAEAGAEVASGQWQEALAHATEADGLRRDDESLRLVAVTALLCRDFPLAWRMYAVLQGDGAPSAHQA